LCSGSLVNRTVAIIIEAITNILKAIRRTDNRVTGVTDSIVVGVDLVDVAYINAVVTNIANPIIIRVALVGVRIVRAVVFLRAQLILIFVEQTHTTERAHEHKECIGGCGGCVPTGDAVVAPRAVVRLVVDQEPCIVKVPAG
jgi:hypothetical protein